MCLFWKCSDFLSFFRIPTHFPSDTFVSVFITDAGLCSHYLVVYKFHIIRSHIWSHGPLLLFYPGASKLVFVLRLLSRADSALCFTIFLFTKRGCSLPCGEIAFDEKLYIKVLVSPYFDKKVSNPFRTKCPIKLFWHRWMYFSTWTISRKWFLCPDPSFWLSNSLKLDFVQTGLSLNQTLTTPDTILCPGYYPYRLQNVWPCRANNAQPNFSLIPHMEFL